MKKRNIILNSFFVAVSYIVRFALAFLLKSVLVDFLGDEYNGLDALLSSIISVLAIAELGIGIAINYNLYKPLKSGDIEKIKSIINFYKKCYRIIALVVFVLGLAIMPFISFFVGEISINENLYIIYSLFVFDSVSSYLLCFRQSIFVADQKNYIISICLTIKTVVLQLCKIIVLIVTKSYIAFTLVSIISNFLHNLILYLLSNKMYPYLKEKNVSPLDKETKEDIKIKVKGLLFHRVGSYIVLGTDNILISKLCDLKTAGFYSNYYLIVNSIQQVIGQMIDVVVPSLGSQLVEDNKETNYAIFRKIHFLVFFIFAVLSTCYLIVVQDFIIVWLGRTRLLDFFTIICISFNLFLFGMRKPMAVFENARGIFYENRFVPLLESAANIIASIALGLWIGLPGIVLGTTISSLWIFFYDYPKYVWPKVFSKPIKNYYLTVFFDFVQLIIVMFLSFIIVNWCFAFINGYSLVTFLIKGFASFIVSSIIVVLLNFKDPSLVYYWSGIKKRFFSMKTKMM